MSVGRGVGIDLVEIGRIRKSMENPNFLPRWFGPGELAQYRARGCKPSFIAACFCAKEAFSKAIGTGIRGFALKEVQLLRNDLGKPELVFSGAAAEIVNSLGMEFETSISHTACYAVAVVIGYMKGDSQ